MPGSPIGVIGMSFCMRDDAADIITRMNFLPVVSFQGFWVLTFPILPFSIALVGGPYNREGNAM